MRFVPPIFRSRWWMLCAGGIALSFAAQFLEAAAPAEAEAIAAAAGLGTGSLELALASVVGEGEVSPGALAVPMRMAGDASFMAGGVWLALLVAWRTLRGAARDIAQAFRPARAHRDDAEADRGPARARRRLPEKQIGAPPRSRGRRRAAPAGPPPPALSEIELAALTPIERVRWRSQARAAGMA